MTAGAEPASGFAWPEALCVAVRSLPEHRRLWVAVSGGLDSTLLLHLACHGHAGAARPKAIHVNHQLQPNAGETESFCRELCQTLGVELTVRRVAVAERMAGGGPSGLEEAARHARYEVFESLLAPGDLLLMAHHADDQAETVLFRLLRGTGVRGLAGMPRYRPLGRGRLFRPLLDFDRAQLVQWATRAGLRWVEDPSNTDPGFDRNFLRHTVLPVLKPRWPGLNRRLAHTATACADSAWLNDRLAEIHWQSCGDDSGRLALTALAGLSPLEQQNLVRWWIRRGGYPLPPRSDWSQVVAELCGAGADREPELLGKGFAVRRYRRHLYLVPQRPPLPTAPMAVTPGRVLAWGEWRVGLYPTVERQGEAPAIRVSTRQGGERFRPAPDRPVRPVKKWLQEQGVPPWERARIPLVFRQEAGGWTLIGIGDLWCHGQYSGSAPVAGWRLIVERDCD
ncbi:tRNA lysidine(34) synthetase TilS [Marinobacter lutaoensis]|jgi:tRNA(Ile)-lysidine synthase|uniref:tRNA(Ile)-lysidine synthase n=1 Tax=Marinobacter lutaoensis TaxID=135739 RepID=A0A1V2DPV7_9GAMM|nr:tRNA lysidine(34) synthetase TilS [Marinobacter lutaoensis]NVD36569.1 tRNA lysidine(34) synthetase TilS [Marinobacter lutaoensis]ONF42436.1 tRNA lysidine(34) synthetase TilS [Marinobacter lutaoensis]